MTVAELIEKLNMILSCAPQDAQVQSFTVVPLESSTGPVFRITVEV